ncbi:DJ-1/PfpI family protein [Leptospira langatensis]|uniref:DJ-1/PfpI family protein n=2 Tax=Leptospira langatensis TaxID=2484983 RepID=A0A5F1ZSG0_9LEPT|nr:DJ-1/PfpI family protein [Leptospira langatensis]TGJ98713.1 DJ-1/PfpI family protein [Leptospira langatensis]TGL40721.1 DJ-1/PfpI family protein [Leptospira langatensis]
MSSEFHIGVLVFPDLTPLDMVGPYEVFSRMKGAKVSLVAESKDPIRSERGLFFLPDLSLEEAPDFDLLLVPGGLGVNRLMENQRVLSWLKTKAEKAQYLTSVCTGSLVLASAGLLKGYQATCHWLSLDVLSLFPGVEVKEDRVVLDRDRASGGGVTAGIDFALSLVAELQGEKAAEEIQLVLEYNPAPPFSSGHPSTVPKEVLEETKASRKKAQDLRKEIAGRAIENLQIVQ